MPLALAGGFLTPPGKPETNLSATQTGLGPTIPGSAGSRRNPDRTQAHSPRLRRLMPYPLGQCVNTSNTYREMKVKVKVTRLCSTLCYSMDYTVHGILQARRLEWVAVPFTRGSSQSRDQIQVSCTAGGFFTN